MPKKFFEKLLLTSALLPLKHKKSPPFSYTNTTKGGDFGHHIKYFLEKLKKTYFSTSMTLSAALIRSSLSKKPSTANMVLPTFHTIVLDSAGSEEM